MGKPWWQSNGKRRTEGEKIRTPVLSKKDRNAISVHMHTGNSGVNEDELIMKSEKSPHRFPRHIPHPQVLPQKHGTAENIEFQLKKSMATTLY